VSRHWANLHESAACPTSVKEVLSICALVDVVSERCSRPRVTATKEAFVAVRAKPNSLSPRRSGRVAANMRWHAESVAGKVFQTHQILEDGLSHGEGKAMTFPCPRCRRNTPHRVLWHTTPPTTMCYMCNEYDSRPIPTVLWPRPQQVTPTKRPRLCQRCYSGSVGGDCVFGTCLEADKPTDPPQRFL
jgi:hypothetical protein